MPSINLYDVPLNTTICEEHILRSRRECLISQRLDADPSAVVETWVLPERLQHWRGESGYSRRDMPSYEFAVKGRVGVVVQRLDYRVECQ